MADTLIHIYNDDTNRLQLVVERFSLDTQLNKKSIKVPKVVS